MDYKNYKRSRYFHRLVSGCKLARYQHCMLRLLTLTTSLTGSDFNLSRDIDVLIKRIRRANFKFEYCRVKTDEGNGVVHVLYKGAYIPKSWIVKNWYSIHKSYIVDIGTVRSDKKLVNYIVSHYLSSQKCEKTQMSWSKGWLPRGAIQVWRDILAVIRRTFYYNDIQDKYYKAKKEISHRKVMRLRLKRWNDYLLSVAYTQVKLDKFFDIGVVSI
jgi:hypothetical protein